MYGERHSGLLKQDVTNKIAHVVGGGEYELSNGASVPKRLFEQAAVRYGLRIDLRRSMPVNAEQICSAAGVPWDGSCDSRRSASRGGSTVTFEGLCRLLEAVERLERRRRRGAHA